MSNLKFSPDLFLEVAEMERFKKFLDQDGFRKNILDNSVSFGLIKSSKDLAFTNARVERDLDTSLGQKTIKIRQISGINSQGQFLASPEINGIPVPADNNWYWVRIKYAFTNDELGTVSLAINGDMVGAGTEFTKVLRGMPNFPSRIRFSNSTYNTGEYDVLEVIDDQHATVVHPATNSSGIAEFVVESNLKYQIVGTFTSGAAIPQDNKYPFQYDFCTYELVQEVSQNQRPTPYVQGMEFYIARVKVNGSTIIIQDKRTEYWETKGSSLAIEVERNENPLIGVEAVKYKHPFSPADLNMIEVAWGMRSKNWAIDSSQNILTLFGSATGGKFKTVDDFTDGDFNGWRLYFANGKYSRVISSVKQGSAINLTVDVLDVDNVSNDGGDTFNNGVDGDWVLVVPNCEFVILKFTAEPADGVVNVNREFAFPVNTLIGICELQVYKDPSCMYNVQYKYESFKEYTPFAPIPSDSSVGYYTEASFDLAGNLKPSDARVTFPYTSDLVSGFIELNLAPFSYHKFTQKVDKGDIIGVNIITNFSSTQVLELVVGTDKQYQYITGNITLNDDVYISLSNTNAIEGNEFRIHFDCTALGLSGKNIFIVRDYTGGSPDIMKKIDQGDVYEMLNHDGGIVFNCVYNGSQWIIYANYEQGEHLTIGMTDGVITDLFDSSGWGKVKGYFGRHLCDGNDGTPDLRDKFITGAGFSYVKGDEGGSDTVTLTIANMPNHRHGLNASGSRSTSGVGYMVQNGVANSAPAHNDQNGQVANAMATVGDNQPFSILPPYYALFYYKKMY